MSQTTDDTRNWIAIKCGDAPLECNGPESALFTCPPGHPANIRPCPFSLRLRWRGSTQNQLGPLNRQSRVFAPVRENDRRRFLVGASVTGSGDG